MIVFVVLYYALFIFWLLLIARIVVEMIRSFARDWRPAGLLAVVLEGLFTVTDPPVKFMRRIIPTIPVGGVRLDISIMILLFGVYILMVIAQGLA